MRVPLIGALVLSCAACSTPAPRARPERAREETAAAKPAGDPSGEGATASWRGGRSGPRPAPPAASPAPMRRAAPALSAPSAERAPTARATQRPAQRPAPRRGADFEPREVGSLDFDAAEHRGAAAGLLGFSTKVFLARRQGVYEVSLSIPVSYDAAGARRSPLELGLGIELVVGGRVVVAERGSGGGGVQVYSWGAVETVVFRCPAGKGEPSALQVVLEGRVQQRFEFVA